MAADPIHARATAPGRAGIAVVRLSGTGALALASKVVGPLPEAGRSLRTLRDASGEPIDEALVLTFAEGASFTGEPVVEFHVHGAPAVVAALDRRLAALGSRPAGPGEFTRRALANGRLDLAQVEGLGALLDAETEAQRRQALRVAQGALGRAAEAWRERLLRALALTEAMIDFSDEELPGGLEAERDRLVAALAADLTREADAATRAERLRDGYEVALVGAPNAGKSSLLNALARREAALVTDIPGTTRDVIEVRLNLAGLPVTLLDTAGLREAGDAVEALGIARGRERARAADLRLVLIAPGEDVLETGSDDLLVRTKADLGGEPGPGLAVSTVTGQGLDQLTDAIAANLAPKAAGLGAGLTARHAAAMTEAADALSGIPAGAPPEIAADALHRASRALDALVGRLGVEDILGEIFARFCIGK